MLNLFEILGWCKALNQKDFGWKEILFSRNALGKRNFVSIERLTRVAGPAFNPPLKIVSFFSFRKSNDSNFRIHLLLDCMGNLNEKLNNFYVLRF